MSFDIAWHRRHLEWCVHPERAKQVPLLAAPRVSEPASAPFLFVSLLRSCCILLR
jgi:hypothetical protein